MDKPLISNSPNSSAIEELRNRNAIRKEIDLFEGQLSELSSINYPATNEVKRIFVFFPWNGILVSMVGQAAYFALRTNRNKLLINGSEQKLLNSKKMSVAGLSAGSSLAIGAAYCGMTNELSISDDDVLDTTNLNRIRAGIHEVGSKKTTLAARKIYEINPFAKIGIYGRINKENVAIFIEGSSIIIDEIDDFKMKVLLRREASIKKIPVLMATALGDGFLVDVERYDIENIKPFLGRAEDAVSTIMNTKEIDHNTMKKMSATLIEIDHVPTRAIESLNEIGKNLAGRPQLFSTISADSGTMLNVIRKILLGEKIKSGRYFFDLGRMFDVSSGLDNSEKRKIVINELLGS